MRNGNIGFVFQSFNLIGELTVFENVELPLLYAGVSVHERVDRVNKALERMQISHRTEHYLNNFPEVNNSVWLLPGYCDEPENYIG